MLACLAIETTWCTEADAGAGDRNGVRRDASDAAAPGGSNGSGGK